MSGCHCEKTNNKYALGEGKGADIDHALEQFETAGRVLGPSNISEQYIVATKLPPGYSVNRSGWLMVGEKPVKVNGRIVHVRTTAE